LTFLPDWIRRGPPDEVAVALPRKPRHAYDRVDDTRGKTFFPQPRCRPHSPVVFDHVMERTNHALVVDVPREHDTHRIQDVGLPPLSTCPEWTSTMIWIARSSVAMEFY
jgi:hypothetical protein